MTCIAFASFPKHAILARELHACMGGATKYQLNKYIFFFDCGKIQFKSTLSYLVGKYIWIHDVTAPPPPGLAVQGPRTPPDLSLLYVSRLELYHGFVRLRKPLLFSSKLKN